MCECARARRRRDVSAPRASRAAAAAGSGRARGDTPCAQSRATSMSTFASVVRAARGEARGEARGAARGAVRAAAAVCAALVLALALALALGAAPARALPLDDDGGLNLDPISNEYARCLAADGREGVCVVYLQCYSNRSLAVGGVIYKNDIRDAAAPISNCGHNLWCCTDDSAAGPAPQQRRPDTGADCTRAAGESCPWCVALYRPGGDPARGQRTDSGLYCAGALVGARTVLTSASCIRTVGEEAVWARVPASAGPARRYTVADRIIHDNYSTATHANDFGLLVLNEKVSLVQGASGACLSLRPPAQGACFTAGFDDQERIVLVAVTVRVGGCGQRARNISDEACGVGAGGRCVAAPGAPVLCPLAPGGQGGRAVAGVVRRRCEGGAARLGLLQQHAGWLQQQLARLGVPAAQYDAA